MSDLSSNYESESEAERSRPKRREPETTPEPGLFVNPTIARDEAQGESSRRKELLTSFNSRVTSGPPLQQRNGDAQLIPPVRLPPRPGGVAPPPPPFEGVNPHIRPPRTIIRERARRRSRVRSRSRSDPGSYPRAKISTKSAWRRKATRKRPGGTKYYSSDENTTSPRTTRENGASSSSRLPRASSGKSDRNDAQSSLDSAAVESSRPDINTSNQVHEEDMLAKVKVLRSDATGSNSDADSEQPRNLGDASSSANEEEISDQEDTTLAEALNAVADKFLHLDVVDQKDDVSKFIAYLLDTIERLQMMMRFNQATDDDASSTESSTDTDDEEKPVVPRGQILHRVYCSNDDHDHDRNIFEDEPVYKGKNRMLTGQISVISIDFFLRRHPDVSYIVMKEYKCAGTERRRSRRAFMDLRDGMSERSELIYIESPKLRKALFQVAEFHPFPATKHSGSTFKMDAPYHFLFHHRRELEKLSQGPTYADVLRPLLEWLKDKYEKEYEEADHLFKNGFVTARHMSKLFKPNQMVVNRRDPELSAKILQENVVFKKEKMSFQGWSWQYDGHILERCSWNESMGMISEEQTRISDLMIHPMDYATQKDKSILEKRGQKYWAMRDQTYTCYTGWDMNQEYHYRNARFMIDTATYHLMNPMADFNNALAAMVPNGGAQASHSAVNMDHEKFDSRPFKISKDSDISPEDIMLLPSSVIGFNFQGKKWTRLFVANTHDVDWNKKAFDRLVLDQKMKDMIYALVDVQKSAGKMEDIITGKGNGLIILLHGSPGTGKTLTAESVAEISEKPLYRVTCGDIGTKAEDVEKYLETVMYLGKIWNCVLLLDEADVFLEERTMADLQRNSLVSVFLRTLEYYEGILILTSNRVGTFDEAFKSRIQVAIHYNNLTKTSRKAIWQNFFDMIEESPDEDANLPELERRLDELARQDMNGRQIRNALLTARQLAKHRRETLDWSHLSQVIKTSAEFHKYLVTVKGHSDDQWAREEALR